MHIAFTKLQPVSSCTAVWAFKPCERCLCRHMQPENWSLICSSGGGWATKQQLWTALMLAGSCGLLGKDSHTVWAPSKLHMFKK